VAAEKAAMTPSGAATTSPIRDGVPPEGNSEVLWESESAALSDEGEKLLRELEAANGLPEGEQMLARVAEVSDPVSPGQIPARRTIVEIGSVVARQILVHEASGAKSEVFVRLREAVLPGTEFTVVRDGSALQVQFFSHAEDALAFLVQHREDLQEHLTRRLENLNLREVRVSVHGRSDEAPGQSFGQERRRRQEEGPFSPS